jgi:hypothetical protein
MLRADGERDGRRGLAGTRYLTPDERRARGKALRQRVPRQDHGAWEPPEGRRDPVQLLSESNKDRVPELVPIRFGRMMQSPFAFYRGSAALMAADLAATPKSTMRMGIGARAFPIGRRRDDRRLYGSKREL